MRNEQIREQLIEELVYLSDFMLKYYGMSRRETRALIVEILKAEELTLDLHKLSNE